MTKTLTSLRSKADVETHLTLHTLTLVCILSLLICLHFLRCWQGEFVQQSRASSVDDLSLHSRDLNVWFRGDIVRRNWILVTVRGQRVKFYTNKATAEDQIWRTNQQGVIFISMRYSFQIYSSPVRRYFHKEKRQTGWIFTWTFKIHCDNYCLCIHIDANFPRIENYSTVEDHSKRDYSNKSQLKWKQDFELDSPLNVAHRTFQPQRNPQVCKLKSSVLYCTAPSEKTYKII